MSIQAINRNDVSYIKAEQDCGLQGCLRAICHVISTLVLYFFKAICCCFCKDNNTPKISQRKVIDLTPAHLPNSEGIVLHRELLVRIFCYCSMEPKTLTLFLVCRGWYGVVYDACILQLQSRTSLTFQEILLYEKIVGTLSNGNDWNSVFTHCTQLEALNFSGAFPKTDTYNYDPVTERPYYLYWEEKKQKLMAEQNVNINQVLSIISIAFEKCPNFTILDLSRCLGVDCASTPVIYHILGLLQRNENYERLTHLNLASSCKYVEGVILSGLPNLVSLDLTNCSISDAAIDKIAKTCPGLCRLKLSLEGSNVLNLSLLVEKCQSLTHLSIGSIRSIGSPIKYITSNLLPALVKHGHNLEFFYSGYNEDLSEEWEGTLKDKLPDLEIADRDVDFFLEPPPRKIELKLAHLNLTPFPCLDATMRTFSYCDAGTEFPVMAQVCKTWHRIIKEIYILQLGSATCLTLQQLFTYQKRLGIEADKKTRWQCVFKHCKQLEALNFSGAFPETDFSKDWEPQNEKRIELAREISSITQAAAKLSTFKILDFSHSKGLIFGGGFSSVFLRNSPDSLIWKAIHNVPQLTHLNIRGCNVDLKAIPEILLGLSQLVSLDFSRDGLVDSLYNNDDPQWIAWIGNCCPNLQRLKFSFCEELGAKHISVFAEKFPKLTHLSSMGTNITSEGWFILAEKCKNLVFLQFGFVTVKRELMNQAAQGLLDKWEEDFKLFKETYPKIAISTRGGFQPFDDIFLDKAEEK
jgi:hypothetical protein